MTSAGVLKTSPLVVGTVEFAKSQLKRLNLHPFSLRFALGLWVGSSLALFLAFLFQLDTPQWAGVSVWIMFMQSPRLNYSKVLFWMAGTLVGAVAAIVLILCFAQTPEIFLLCLSLWLAFCAGVATQLREYRAYGAVLSGYTAAIIAFTAVEHPGEVFSIAVTRVSCVCLGMVCAILAMNLFLPRHLHWKQTLGHLTAHSHRILRHAADSLAPASNPTLPSWGHIVERVATLEHTFDFTLAESPDARSRSAQTRSLTATLFCLAAKAQGIQFHLSHAAGNHSPEAGLILERVRALVEKSIAELSPQLSRPLTEEIAAARQDIAILRISSTRELPTQISDRFLLDQLDSVLSDLDHALRDYAGLYGTWTAPRPSRLRLHRDLLMAGVYALRIFLAMGLATAFWYASQWPSGASFLLFLAIVCSLLSLLDHAEKLPLSFLKGVAACFAASFVELFWILQKGEGFPFISVALGLFLIPAAYAYTHPRLAGSAVISMLLFYGLVSPANLMSYDIGVFLNNGLAFLAAAVTGYFAFHVVRSPGPASRQWMLIHAMRRDLRKTGRWKEPLSEQGWISLAFDRLRILHWFGRDADAAQVQRQETLLHAGLLWGLRQIELGNFLENRDAGIGLRDQIRRLLKASGNAARRPAVVSKAIEAAGLQLRGKMPADPEGRAAALGVLAQLQEMASLLPALERVMTGLFKEIDCFGVYLAPFFGCLVVTTCVFLVLSRWMDHLQLQRYVWNRPLFDAAIFCVLLSLIVFLL